MNNIPSRSKYRKSFTIFYKNPRVISAGPTKKGQNNGYEAKLKRGRFGLQSCESGRLSSQTIEAARRAISRKISVNGTVWVKVFADIPITKKPAEVRMGKGKGAVAGWVATISKGQILFEMDGVLFSKALQAAELAKHKIGLKTKFVFSRPATISPAENLGGLV